MSKLLSIIVPVYNAEKYLARCIDSILHQELLLNQYEIVLINDGSCDNSLFIAEQYANKYDHILLFNQSNKGASVARNYGVIKAKGKYINFIDSDDYLEPNYFKYLLDIILLYDLDFLGYGIHRTTSYQKNISLKNPNLNLIEFENQICSGSHFIAQHNFNNSPCWYFVKREVLLKNHLQFIEGNSVEDGIYTTQLLMCCKKTLYVNCAVYNYFINTNSVTKSNSIAHRRKMIDDFVAIIVKFDSLISKAKSDKFPLQAITRLETRQQSYVFFLFIRMLKAQEKWLDFKITMSILKKVNAYPIKKFIGIDYNSRTEKLFTYFFNNIVLFKIMVFINNRFKLIK